MIIMGHRGAAGLAPENTLAGFAAGIKAGADWIEFDVRATKDGKIAVIHDPTTERTFGKPFTVASTNAQALRDLGLPMLEDAVNTIAGKAKLNIEIKSPGCEQAVVEAIQGLHSYDNVMVSSFSKDVLRRVHKLDPNIKLAFLQHINVLGFLSLPFLSAVGFRHFLAPQFALRLAKKRGCLVYAFTVDDPARGKQLLTKGFDAIVTNRPDLFK